MIESFKVHFDRSVAYRPEIKTYTHIKGSREVFVGTLIPYFEKASTIDSFFTLLEIVGQSEKEVRERAPGSTIFTSVLKDIVFSTASRLGVSVSKIATVLDMDLKVIEGWFGRKNEEIEPSGPVLIPTGQLPFDGNDLDVVTCRALTALELKLATSRGSKHSGKHSQLLKNIAARVRKKFTLDNSSKTYKEYGLNNNLMASCVAQTGLWPVGAVITLSHEEYNDITLSFDFNSESMSKLRKDISSFCFAVGSLIDKGYKARAHSSLTWTMSDGSAEDEGDEIAS